MKPDCVVLHNSASAFGDAFLIDGWHRERGFSRIGYHAVILNGHPFSSSEYIPMLDGAIQPGRKLDQPGAHCLNGFNSHSIGICLVGGMKAKQIFSMGQLIAFRDFYFWLRSYVGRELTLFGHHECQDGKTCPDMDMDVVRKFVNRNVSVVDLITQTDSMWSCNGWVV